MWETRFSEPIGPLCGVLSGGKAENLPFKAQSDSLFAIMKADLHPTYHAKTTILCACGNTFETGSTVKDIHIELCSACHPFYTGKQKLLDTSRRIEKFQEKASKQTVSATVGKKAKEAKRAALKDAKKSKADVVQA